MRALHSFPLGLLYNPIYGFSTEELIHHRDIGAEATWKQPVTECFSPGRTTGTVFRDLAVRGLSRVALVLPSSQDHEKQSRGCLPQDLRYVHRGGQNSAPALLGLAGNFR